MACFRFGSAVLHSVFARVWLQVVPAAGAPCTNINITQTCLMGWFEGSIGALRWPESSVAVYSVVYSTLVPSQASVTLTPR